MHADSNVAGLVGLLRELFLVQYLMIVMQIAFWVRRQMILVLIEDLRCQVLALCTIGKILILYQWLTWLKVALLDVLAPRDDWNFFDVVSLRLEFVEFSVDN